MKSFLVILFVSLAALTAGSYMSKNVKYADKTFLTKQKFVFDIFQHVHQDEIFGKLYETGKTYNFQEHYGNFNNVELVKEFFEIYEHSPIPEDDLFSAFDEDQLVYAKNLFYAFYYAKDWETFYSTVLWARFHVNKGAFIYALSTAILQRDDMAGIVLPPIYEIYPFYFFDAETIQMAQNYKMQGFQDFKKVEEVYTAVIPTNYTGFYGHINYDNLLAYFMEDIGLNSFYFYQNLDYPTWWSGDKDQKLINDRRGEFYFFLHQQILARYYMERLSNDLGEIQEFTWNDVYETGYYPGLRYYNGLHFPTRDNDYNMYKESNYYWIDEIEMFAQRILDGIDRGYFYKGDKTHYDYTTFQAGLEALGNIVQGNVDSVNTKYYGSFEWLLRQIISHSYTHGEHELPVPGVLNHYSTSLRDPAFYQMFKRILRFYNHFIDNYEPYSVDELNFSGVKIESVEMDKLVTYYDKFDADISNAVEVDSHDDHEAVTDLMKFGRLSGYSGHDFLIKARTYRLNHLPWTFKMNVVADKAEKAFVKVFLGPKLDAYDHKIQLTDNRENFYEVDHFVVDLVEGKNMITRNSDDFSWYVNDRTTYFELYKKLMLATNTADNKFPLDMTEAHCGFPQRLMLPKGKKGGMPFQFFFILYPYQAPKVAQFQGFDPSISCGIGSGARYVDDMPFGYPFDRKINERFWTSDNLFFFDTMIFHKTETDVNAVHH